MQLVSDSPVCLLRCELFLGETKVDGSFDGSFDGSILRRTSRSWPGTHGPCDPGPSHHAAFTAAFQLSGSLSAIGRKVSRGGAWIVAFLPQLQVGCGVICKFVLICVTLCVLAERALMFFLIYVYFHHQKRCYCHLLVDSRVALTWKIVHCTLCKNDGNKTRRI